MTLMPVSNMVADGSRVSKAGAWRWISHRSATSPSSSEVMSSGSPITLKTWPSTLSPTGTVMPGAGVARPRCRGVRPSVGLRQMARTRLSPICWATSARTSISLPSTVDVHRDGRC